MQFIQIKPEPQVKKPNPPKKPLTPFFLFLQDKRAEIKQKHPEAKVVEIAQIGGQMWSLVEPKEKQLYDDRSQVLKGKYETELKEYEDKWGKINKQGKSSKQEQSQQIQQQNIHSSNNNDKQTKRKTREKKGKTVCAEKNEKSDNQQQSIKNQLRTYKNDQPQTIQTNTQNTPTVYVIRKGIKKCGKL